MYNVETNKENICVNKIVGQKKDFIFIEGDAIVPDIKPDILNTISTTGNAYIYKKEVTDGKIKMEGTVDAYVIYLADDDSGSTRGINTSINFSQVINIDNCMQDMAIDESVEIKNIECNVLNGRKINIKVGLEIGAVVYSNENVDIITGFSNANDVQSLVTPLQITTLVGEGTARTYAKDNISIDEVDNLAEILKCDVNIINKDMKISYNKVLAKGDAEVKIMYLTDDSRIKTITSKIQLMGFVDIQNIKEDSICDMKYKVKNILVKPNPTEEHSIYVEIEIELVCRAYENMNTDIIQDLYSPTQNLNFTQKSIKTMTGKCCTKDIHSIKEKLNVPELQNNEIYDVDVKPVLKETNILNNRISYEGDIELNFLCNGNSGRMENIQYLMPFNYSIDIEDVNNNSALNTEIDILVQNFVMMPDGSIDSNIDLQFNIDVSKATNINIIDEISVDETRDNITCSMVIYFVKPGDTLWKIAKRFKSTVEDIMRVNEIENENKIYPGQQLFIPKYVCTRKEVLA